MPDPVYNLGVIQAWGARSSNLDVYVTGHRNYVPVTFSGSFYDQGYEGYGTDYNEKPFSSLNDVHDMDLSSTSSLLSSLSAASQSTLTPAVLAAFSTWIYRYQQPGPNGTTQIPTGYTQLSNAGIESSASGFFGIALRQDFTGDVIFVTRGSQEAIDFADDADLVNLGMAGSNASDFAQYDDMIRLVNDVAGGLTQGSDIYFAGHSLGGALAAAGVAYSIAHFGESFFNLSGTTFGTLPIGNVLNYQGIGNTNAGAHIVNYMRPYDPATYTHAFGNVPGQVVQLPIHPSDIVLGVGNHDIARYTAEAPTSPWEIDIGRDQIPYADPIFIDLDGDGVSVVSRELSNVHYDFDGDGRSDSVAWVDSGDGVLYLDIGNDGLVTQREEVAFSVLAGAHSDLDALRMLDENRDGIFSDEDSWFGFFKVWSDANGDGRQTANESLTLAQAGIASIDVHLDHNSFFISDARVNNTSTVTFDTGQTSAAWDIDLQTIDHQSGWYL